ncbi:MAG: hypothetical protein F6K37_33060 [Moorea sp. SIO4E2]|uniref:RICIN domain-containing protein n=1 Tax=Moorena sp. SIO4E2 TaxID=2607826 RepID=UPI0013B6C153|nr:ricin-type beta-trefoil lectin domain protein [Moorena sp. SIO4E2]NEQ10577.1 hypothetical protein [Moorena sp. SIO4E2]
MEKIQRNCLLKLQIILMSLVLMLGSMTISPNTALAGQFHINSFDNGGVYQLKTQLNGKNKCLQVVNDNDHNKLMMANCDNFRGQQWSITPFPNSGGYRLTTQFTGNNKCLEVVNNTQLKMTRCRPKHPLQKWNIIPFGNSDYKLKVKVSGKNKCLQVVNKNDNKLMMATCRKSIPSQQWSITPFRNSIVDDKPRADQNLGPLADLYGKWYGQGWNMIAIPIKRKSGTHTECTIEDVPGSKESFCIHAEPFCDVLDFKKKTETVDKLFPKNITVFGLEYEHTVFSSKTWEPGQAPPACPKDVSNDQSFKKIHGEKGAWLFLGQENGKNKVARIFSLTRGNTVLALGQAQSQKLEEIKETGGFPVAELGKDRERYNTPYRDLKDLLKGYFNLENPNEVLDQDIIKGNATVLEVSTAQKGGAIASIPFFDMANGVEGDFQIPKFKSTFWIENTHNKSELQLQYSETTDFDFRKDLSGDLVLWPHVDVSTLCQNSYCQ